MLVITVKYSYADDTLSKNRYIIRIISTWIKCNTQVCMVFGAWYVWCLVQVIPLVFIVLGAGLCPLSTY